MIIKKTSAILLVLSLSICLGASMGLGNVHLAFDLEKSEISTFLDVGGNRTAGSDGEKKVANYLETKLSELGLSSLFENFSQPFKFSGKDSQNIVAVKNSQSEKYVVIGSHYDNIYKAGTSVGANDNASGVVANLTLASQLKDVQLPFNIVFAFFGAEETGLNGSNAFLESLDKKIKENILLYINLDSVGAGNNLYYFHSDFNTKYGRYLDGIFENYPVEKLNPIKAMFSKRNSLGLNYTHLGYMSDNASFLKQGINSVNFFAGDLDVGKLGFHETNAEKLMHNTDSLEKTEELFGETFYYNILTVKNLVLDLITEENFVQLTVDREINAIMYSDVLLKGIGIILVGLLILCVIIFFKVKDKKLKTADASQVEKEPLSQERKAQKETLPKTKLK